MAGNLQSGEGAKPGDITWVRLDRRSRLSWWPAQVVEEDSINAKSKRKKREVGDVLVRLYGTYSYLYTNLCTQGPEFEKDLRSYDITAREAFQRALKKDMARTLSNQHEEADKENNTTVNVKDQGEAEKSKINPKKRKAAKAAKQSLEAEVTKREADGFERSSDACRGLGMDNSESVKTPPSRVRRMKIMRNLGLIAPPGSPFKIRTLTS